MSWKGARKGRLLISKSVTYRTTHEQYKRLVKFCTDNDTTQAAVIREALDSFMAEHAKRPRRSASAGEVFD